MEGASLKDGVGGVEQSYVGAVVAALGGVDQAVVRGEVLGVEGEEVVGGLA